MTFLRRLGRELRTALSLEGPAELPSTPGPAFVGDELVRVEGEVFEVAMFWREPDPIMDEVLTYFTGVTQLRVEAPWGTPTSNMVRMATEMIRSYMAESVNRTQDVMQLLEGAGSLLPDRSVLDSLFEPEEVPAPLPVAKNEVLPDPPPRKKTKTIIDYDPATREVVFRDVEID